MLSSIYKTSTQLARHIATRVKARRLAENWSRKTLAERSGIPESTIKHFESTDKISLHALLSLAIALNAAAEFNALFPDYPLTRIKQIQTTTRQRGRR